MSNRITMQECHPTSDAPHIGTRMLWTEITDQMVEHACRAMRYLPGNHILVQSFNHERTHLLAERVYCVDSAVTAMERVSKDDLTEQSVEKTTYTVSALGEWRVTDYGKVVAKAAENVNHPDADQPAAKPSRKAA